MHPALQALMLAAAAAALHPKQVRLVHAQACMHGQGVLVQIAIYTVFPAAGPACGGSPSLTIARLQAGRA